MKFVKSGAPLYLARRLINRALTLKIYPSEALTPYLTFFTALTLVFTLLCTPLYPAKDSSEDAYLSLKKSFAAKDKENFESDAALFLKKYPASRRVPDVRLLIADKETDTDIAVGKYRLVVKNYSRYPGREYALFRICQILDLKSRWKELREESGNGIRLFPAGSFLDDFRFMHITSLMMLEDYSGARDEAIKITERTHDFETLSKAIFFIAEAERKTSGNSKSYIQNLKELAVGFKESELYPSILLRLAIFYEEKKDYDRGYSAYSDITEHFADSPEASIAIQRLDRLKKLKPKKVSYIPDNVFVEKTDDIDLAPEYEIKKETDEIFYSVSIGPFTKQNDASSITRLLKNYNDKKKVKTPYGYMVYIGKFIDSDSALDIRIRLAEEYGINGNIVRFSVHDKKSYIYEDR